MQRTLVLIKPDAINRELVGEILKRIESKGLRIVGLKMLRLTDDILNDHYGHLLDKPFFPEIKTFMTSTPVVALCVEGLDSVDTVRKLAGITLARDADPGTVRGDFAMSVQCNLIHASDSVETAKKEIARFFNDDELFNFSRSTESVIYSPTERESK